MSRVQGVSNKLAIGTVLSIPCDVRKGALATERVIQCKIESPHKSIEIEGIVSPELTLQGKRVVAVISDKPKNGFITLMFSGEIYSPGNPVKVPIEWLQSNMKIERVAA